MSKYNLDEMKSQRLDEMFSDIELEPTTPLVASAAEVEAWLKQIRARQKDTRASMSGLSAPDEDVRKIRIKCPSCGYHYDLPDDTTTFICVHCFNKYAVRRKVTPGAEQAEAQTQSQPTAPVQEKAHIPWYKRLLIFFSRKQ